MVYFKPQIHKNLDVSSGAFLSWVVIWGISYLLELDIQWEIYLMLSSISNNEQTSALVKRHKMWEEERRQIRQKNYFIGKTRPSGKLGQYLIGLTKSIPRLSATSCLDSYNCCTWFVFFFSLLRVFDLLANHFQLALKIRFRSKS